MNSQHFLLVNPPNLFPLLEIATGFLVLKIVREWLNFNHKCWKFEKEIV